MTRSLYSMVVVFPSSVVDSSEIAVSESTYCSVPREDSFRPLIDLTGYESNEET